MNFVNEVLDKDQEHEVPENEYFKGFWCFALWGYIPPPGFEEYQCTMISTVVEDSDKSTSTSNGRADSKQKLLERRIADKALDKRGVALGSVAAVDKSEQRLLELMSKGRIEQMQQKKFVLTRDKFELQMRFKSEEMNDIKDEMKMLDSDDNESKKTLKKKMGRLETGEKESV